MTRFEENGGAGDDQIWGGGADIFDFIASDKPMDDCMQCKQQDFNQQPNIDALPTSCDLSMQVVALIYLQKSLRCGLGFSSSFLLALGLSPWKN
jgi:hypothetical protein